MSSRGTCISEFTLFTSVTFRKPEKSATTFPWVSIAPFGFPEREIKEANWLEAQGPHSLRAASKPAVPDTSAVHPSLWPSSTAALRVRGRRGLL